MADGRNKGLSIETGSPRLRSILHISQTSGHVNTRIAAMETESFHQNSDDGSQQVKKKAGYTATPVACGWAGAIIEVSGAFGQEQLGQKPH